MSIKHIGSISAMAGKRFLALVAVVMLIVTAIPSYTAWRNTSVECVRCHGDKEKMTKLGYPFFYATEEMVAGQSKHPNIECRDCHLGNGRAKDRGAAHKGMLKALILGEHGEILDRGKIFKGPLLPSGDNRIYEMLPKVDVSNIPDVSDATGGNSGKSSSGKNTKEVPFEVRNLLWHDRNTKTLNFDPDIAKKTCGKPDCHPRELKQFQKSIMGRNFRQRTMRTWTEPYGPHNCGPSFADLPAEKELSGAGFSYENTGAIAKDLNVPFNKAQAEDKQKFCNVCHAGCLDCHYTPGNKEGVHSFTKIPKSESCAGFGRGTSICHPGAMQSRRGETYIGGDYSVPPGMEPDIHYKKGIHCVDCHPTGEQGMGDVQRKASCQDCHIEIEDAHAKGVHKNLDCAACHLSELRGYQLTIWGPGVISGDNNPFKKYSLYYGIQSPPVIVKDKSGLWRPYKIWPHSVGNIKNDVKPSAGIEFRWNKGETNDANYTVGTFDGLPGNNKHLLWIQFDQASHPYGKARKCDSCHTGPQVSRSRQVAHSQWEFFDNYGAYPFKGEHDIVADSKGLAIVGLKNTSPIELMKGFKLTDFASWLYMKDKWRMPGDFAIKADEQKYKKSLERALRVENLLKAMDEAVKEVPKEAPNEARKETPDKKSGPADVKEVKDTKDAKDAAYAKLVKRYGVLKGKLLHNPDDDSILEEAGKLPGLKGKL
ncbi:MAG: hypothetical protein HQK89_11045 [Nitrospirae bacterium]|nr:hypothetical protein [Nitrospirota bacterium]